jgi:hypothetical protein
VWTGVLKFAGRLPPILSSVADAKSLAFLERKLMKLRVDQDREVKVQHLGCGFLCERLNKPKQFQLQRTLDKYKIIFY